MEVGMMAASDVATATCMRYSSGTPAKRNEYSSTGTVTMPPPTPSMPAAKPAKTPEAASTRISGSSPSKLALAIAGGCRGVGGRGFGERPAGATREGGLHLADDRERDRFGRAATDVEADG